VDEPRSNDSAVLETTRLVLRDFEEHDAERITEYFGENDAQVHVLRGQRRPEGWASYVARATQYAGRVPFASRPYLGLAVVLRDTRELIGMCTLWDAQPNSVRARIGWHFSNRFSGLGYATEASREVIRYAFEKRKVARVYADCFESNAANVRVFAKLGMRPWPCLALVKWLLAVKYLERKPIVRYTIENQLLGESTVA
jgi:[ribosomal protein S5]-alanine N-acetyltransferase